MKDDIYLESRLRQLEARTGVADALARYCHCVDYAIEAEWVDCFTEDGVFDVRRGPSGGGDSLVQGRAELAAFIAKHTRPPEHWHKHCLAETIFDIQDTTAHTDSYWFRVQAHETGPFIRAFGHYRDDLVLCDDGRWRFQHRIVEINGTIHPLG